MKWIGFTPWEAVVIAVAVLGVACMVWPVVAPAQPGVDRQTLDTCTSHIRQIATAVLMHTQDNAGRYPPVRWNTAVEAYVGTRRLFTCPADDSTLREPISYGYSSLLVRADGSGCNEAQIQAPTEVGCIADATPTCTWDGNGGLIGGDAMGKSTALMLTPRHDGILIGYCDGHAKYHPGAPINTRDLTSGPSRAFYQALNLGLIKNYGGGLSKMPIPMKTPTVVIGGDYAGMPLVMAAADVWATEGGKWFSRGFRGVNLANDWTKAKTVGTYVWVDASGSGAGMPVAQDALVFVVAKDCRILAIDKTGIVTTSNLVRMCATGYTEEALQVYTYDASNGNRAYLAGKLRGWGAVKDKEIGVKAQVVGDDSDMVEKVANDPCGIGYCSSAMADPERVTILALRIGTTTHAYPSNNSETRWVVPWRAADCTYPLLRTLRVRTAGDGAAFAKVMTAAEFYTSPQFRTGYFQP